MKTLSLLLWTPLLGAVLVALLPANQHRASAPRD